MLRTYTLTNATDFILYLLDKQQDDLMWQVWLHRKPTKGEGKDIKYLTFDEYKKAAKSSLSRVTIPTPEEEKRRLDFASQFIKIRKESDHYGNG